MRNCFKILLYLILVTTSSAGILDHVALDLEAINRPQKADCAQFRIIKLDGVCRRLANGYKALEREQNGANRADRVAQIQETIEKSNEEFKRRLEQLDNLGTKEFENFVTCFHCTEGLIDPANQYNIDSMFGLLNCHVPKDGNLDKEIYCQCAENRGSVLGVEADREAAVTYQKEVLAQYGQIYSRVVDQMIADIANAVAENAVLNRASSMSAQFCQLDYLYQTMDRLSKNGCGDGGSVGEVHQRIADLFGTDVDSFVGKFKDRATEQMLYSLPLTPDAPGECHLPKQLYLQTQRMQNLQWAQVINRGLAAVNLLIGADKIRQIFAGNQADPLNEIISFLQEQFMGGKIVYPEGANIEAINSYLIALMTLNRNEGSKLKYILNDVDGWDYFFSKISQLDAKLASGVLSDEMLKEAGFSEELFQMMSGDNLQEHYNQQINQSCKEVFVDSIEKLLCTKDAGGLPSVERFLKTSEDSVPNLQYDQMYCEEQKQDEDFMRLWRRISMYDDYDNENFSDLIFQDSEFEQWNKMMCPIMKACNTDEKGESYCFVRDLNSVSEMELMRMSKSQKELLTQTKEAQQFYQQMTARQAEEAKRVKSDTGETWEGKETVAENQREVLDERDVVGIGDSLLGFQEEEAKEYKETLVLREQSEDREDSAKARTGSIFSSNKFANSFVSGKAQEIPLRGTKEEIAPQLAKKEKDHPLPSPFDSGDEAKVDKINKQLDSYNALLDQRQRSLDERFASVKERAAQVEREQLGQQISQNDDEARRREQKLIDRIEQQEQRIGSVERENQSLRQELDRKNSMPISEREAVSKQSQEIMPEMAVNIPIEDGQIEALSSSASKTTGSERAQMGANKGRATGGGGAVTGMSGGGVDAGQTVAKRAYNPGYIRSINQGGEAAPRRPVVKEQDFINLSDNDLAIAYQISALENDFELRTKDKLGNSISIPMSAVFNGDGTVAKYIPTQEAVLSGQLNAIASTQIRSELFGSVKEGSSSVPVMEGKEFLGIPAIQVFSRRGQNIALTTKDQSGEEVLIPMLYLMDKDTWVPRVTRENYQSLMGLITQLEDKELEARIGRDLLSVAH